MARFCGLVGFAQTVQTAPGVFSEVTIERTYRGNVIRDSRSWENSEHLNDNLRLGNRISILADNFALNNFSYMRYIHWMGVLWEVTNVEVQRPRLILSVGGKYNAS